MKAERSSAVDSDMNTEEYDAAAAATHARKRTATLSSSNEPANKRPKPQQTATVTTQPSSIYSRLFDSR